MDRLSAIVWLALLAGCVPHIHETMDDTTGITIDAQQRAILRSKGDSDNTRTVWCAEPSPDAISAIAASSAGTFANPQQQAQLALTVAQQTASIGLRTQSIQLMRDAMYRACEAYLNGAIGKPELYRLQRRFQNLTLGLLAIEQLTGAVRADQATLSTGGAAGTGGDTEKEETALQKAQQDEVSANTEYETAKSDLDEANKAVEQQRDVVKTAQAEVKKSNTQEAKDTLKQAQEELATRQSTAKTKSIFANDKLQRLRIATQTRMSAEMALNAARLRVRSAASGSAYLQAVAESRKDVTEKTAKAVQDVVQTVLAASGHDEECAAILDDYRIDKAKWKQPIDQALIKACLNEKIAENLQRAKSAGLTADQASKLLSQ